MSRLSTGCRLHDPEVGDFLQLWAETAEGSARLISVSENHVYLVQCPSSGLHVLRLHRPRYQLRAAVQSEIAWLRALVAEGEFSVPVAIAGIDGNLLQQRDGRLAVLFRHQEGTEPAPTPTLFRALGSYAARLHEFVLRWTAPPGFQRPVLDTDALLGARAIWGAWRQAPGVTPQTEPMITQLEQRMGSELATYGRSAERFGLIHGDMRTANLLESDGQLALIDFDDCGFGWFGYDLAAALSFIDHQPAAAELTHAWIEGYREVRALGAADIEILDTLILLRRMALLAWIGTHAETELAQAHAPHFAWHTAELAGAYLSR